MVSEGNQGLLTGTENPAAVHQLPPAAASTLPAPNCIQTWHIPDTQMCVSWGQVQLEQGLPTAQMGCRASRGDE